MPSAPTFGVAPAKDNPFSELSAHLINHNFRERGCDNWSRDRFNRLCGKLQRTEREMAALMRIAPFELRARLITGFTKQDGLILTILEHEIDFLHTGNSEGKGLFHITYLQQNPGQS